MSFIAIAGDVHGKISLFYEKVLELQEKIGFPIEAVFQLGDLQLYSETSKVDGAVIRHGGPGEFPIWLREKRAVPIHTYTILGNHDDAELFYEYAGKEIIPSLHLLPQGEVISIIIGESRIRICAIGGNYSPKYFPTDPAKLPQGRKRHYTQAHIDSIMENAPIDILLTHEAPLGFVVRGGSDLGRPEISDLIEKTQPKLAFFGHHHTYVSGKIGETIVTGLAGIHRPEGVIIMEIGRGNDLQLFSNICQF